MRASRPGRSADIGSFLKEHLLKAVLLVAVTGAAAGWLKGLAGNLLPDSEGPRCWIEEQWQSAQERWQKRFAGTPATDTDHFTVLLTRLARDPDGAQTAYVDASLDGEKGFHRLSTCRVITRYGNDRNAAEDRAEAEAEKLRTSMGADLVLWGEVGPPGSVRIWMTGPTVRADLKARPWKMDEHGEAAFRARFATALQAIVLAALKPARSRGEDNATSDLLRPLLPRLDALRTNLPEHLTPDTKATLLSSVAWGFNTYGEQAGDNEYLRKAIDAHREALAATDREQAPDDWASRQNSLGYALFTLGGLESGASHLEQAIATFRAATEIWTHEQAPREWAMIQSNLCGALAMLGERESATARLEAAVATCRAALTERTPVNWSLTQINLGAALLRLGERDSGTEQLNESASASRAALQGLAREAAPFRWAMAQMNLGNAFWRLGEREGGTTHLEQAVTAYRAALEEWMPERAPLRYAMLQTNLCAALTTLGERESGIARLEEAVAACDAALADRTRERAPRQRIMAQINRGVALWRTR